MPLKRNYGLWNIKTRYGAPNYKVFGSGRLKNSLKPVTFYNYSLYSTFFTFIHSENFEKRLLTVICEKIHFRRCLSRFGFLNLLNNSLLQCIIVSQPHSSSSNFPDWRKEIGTSTMNLRKTTTRRMLFYVASRCFVDFRTRSRPLACAALHLSESNLCDRKWRDSHTRYWCVSILLVLPTGVLEK